MPSGKVKWFNSKKGYGFITEDKTEKDIFLHVSELEGSKLRVLKENQKLEFEIKKDLNEETLGELFSYFMLETALVGKMAKINPFNQPAVEQIKIITKNLLN